MKRLQYPANPRNDFISFYSTKLVAVTISCGIEALITYPICPVNLINNALRHIWSIILICADCDCLIIHEYNFEFKLCNRDIYRYNTFTSHIDAFFSNHTLVKSLESTKCNSSNCFIFDHELGFLKFVTSAGFAFSLFFV